MLDERYNRDPTYSFHGDQMPVLIMIFIMMTRSLSGECQGASTQMLSSTQWSWLEEELAKEAEITVIVSGVQVVMWQVFQPTDREDWCDISKVLQPTDQTKIEEYYCAHDSHSGGGNTFHEAIAQVLLSTSPPSWFTLGRLKQSSSYHQDYHHYDHSANLGIPNIMWPDIENQSP